MNHKLPTLLDLHDMCRLFGVSPRTIYRWRNRNTGPVGQLVGGKLLWDRDTVVDWLRFNSEKTGRGER
jgi:predicted DNA-binding transcriptional regulator AlpA